MTQNTSEHMLITTDDAMRQQGER